jgi:ADP-ribose pyrophosphatase YjhB (NUDIX family)
LTTATLKGQGTIYQRDMGMMERGIENFGGVVIENTEGEILLARKLDDYAYALPWCRIRPGQSLTECISNRVMDLTGLTIHPVFVGPNEHIEEGSHFISFDHMARIDSKTHHYSRDDIDYLWVHPNDLETVPLVPLTRKMLANYCKEEVVGSQEPEARSQEKSQS